MALTKKELISILEMFADDTVITNQQNQDFIHITNIGDNLILSTDKPIGTCDRNGTYVYPSMINGYSGFSPLTNEDLYSAEFNSINHGEFIKK